MASHRRPKQASHAYATALTATAAAAVALSAQPALADPLPDPNKTGVQAQIDRLYEEATQATEKYNGAKEKAGQLEKQVKGLQASAARKQSGLNDLRNRLGSIAAAQYRSGGLDLSVQLLLSSDPNGFLDKAAALDRLSTQQLSELQRYEAQQREIQQQRQQAAGKLKDLESTRKELGDKKKEIQGKLAQAQKLLTA
ncbi:hypothetical protein [Streptomyces sp. NPDC005077]|uniref:coiled-coil domain-containing protein n=1 Tax=Streptomyces sp. NPDC005077 TaxID=3154292 RepID=UPI0033B37BF4